MKKFFLTILLVITAVFTASAQSPLNLNMFQHEVTKGQCNGDSKLKITLPPGMGAAGTQLQVKLDIPNDPVGRTEPMEIGVTGRDTYEFTTLKVGTYTVTLIEVSSQKRSNPRTVAVTSNYVPPIFTAYKTYAPSCAGAGVDGRVEFTIQQGAKGPFEVTLTKGSTTIYSNLNLQNPNPAVPFPVTIQGSASQPITQGSDYVLTVVDKAGGVANCGETNRRGVIIPAPTLTLDCIEIELVETNSAIRTDQNCKFGFSFQIRRKDGVSLERYETDIKARANAAVVRRYNAAGTLIGGPYDVTNTYASVWRGNNIANSYSFLTGYRFDEGDIAEIEINIGTTPIKKRIKIDSNVVDVVKNTTGGDNSYTFRDTAGSRLLAVGNSSNMKITSATPCPTAGTRYLYVDTYARKVNLPDADDPTKTVSLDYYWQNGYDNWLQNPTSPGAGYYYLIYRYVGTGYPGWNNGYSQNNLDETDTTKWLALVGGVNYTWVNKNYADLSSQPDGWYMVKFMAKDAGGNTFCYAPKRVIKMEPKQSNIGTMFGYIEKAKGAYKNTVTIYRWLSVNTFSYPLTVSVDYLDDGGTGTRTYNFHTSLPFETSQRTVTYTFPIVKTIGSPADDPTNASAFMFGDLPAGSYRITLTDACGNTTYKDLNFDTPMVYDRDQVQVVKGCNNASSISYNIATTPNATIRDADFTLYKKNSAGQYTQFIERSKNPSHIFNNLAPGDYRLEVKTLHYTRMAQLVWTNNNQQGPTGTYNWVPIANNPAFNGVSTINNRSIEQHTGNVYLTISPTGELKRDVVGTSCSAAAGTGLVAVRITNPEYINYPIQFTLKNKATNAVVQTSPAFQEGSGTTNYVFKNVPNGTYIVETSHGCGAYPDEVAVNSNNYTAPGITYVAQSTSPCNGDVVELTFGGSTQLFDIEWFRVEADNTETSLGITQTITDTVKRATRYLVRYNLADTTLCVVNPSGVASITPQFTADTTPPVITGCPTGTITVNTVVGQCYGVATWGTVTATDDCRVGAWSQTHQSGQHFDIGLHTVTYVFEDTSGNVATCTFNVEVKSQAIDMQMSDAFVDGTNGVITHNLATTESLYYRIRYRNTGQENVTSATMQITLPNHAGVRIGTPDFSGAIETTFRPVVTGQTSNTFIINIPPQTLRPGQQERTILIPLQLNGDCNEFGKPCMNILQASYTFAYEGGRPNCIVPEQTKTSSTTILVSTAACNRTELFCADPPVTTRLTAIAGFDRYIWYKNGVQQVNPLNLNYIDATTTGTYRVEKVKECNGTTYTTTEQIQLVDGDTIADPIRSQANGGDACPSDGTYVSHIILCNESSRTLNVTFRDSRIEWQRLKTGVNPTGQNCPNYDDSNWDTVATTPSFTVNSTAHYRLRVTNAGNNCWKVFYFDVFSNALSGQLDPAPINISSYQMGKIFVKMATSGISYRYVIKDSNGTVVPQNGDLSVTKNSSSHEFIITQPDTYTIEVTSPSLPQSCKWVAVQKIERDLVFTAKAAAKAWKSCNVRTLNFQASGGAPTFSFAIWSIDGIIQKGYTNYTDVQASDYIANGIPAGIIGQDRDVAITQPGKYVFLARDAQNAYALTPEIDIYPEDFLGYTIGTRDIVCGDLPNSGQISVTYNTQQNVRSTLYRYDAMGNEVYVDDNTTGFFDNLIAAKYRLEIKITMGTSASATCTYSNPNLEVKSIDSSIRAFAGVAEDISCDTSSPTKQYKVIVNNVSGGTGTGYEFSANNVNYSTNPVLMVGSTASVVYVRDSNKCVLEIPIKIVPIVPATVTTTAVQYDCEGKGTFTVTTNPTGDYKFQITSADGTLSETRTTNVFTLSPGVYSIYAIYTPANVTATTPNILYKEDFGTGLDTCNSDVIFITCNSNGTALANNQYMITRQVPTLPLWVNPTPTDASGVTDGRYLAINGGATANDSGVVYRRTINGVVPNQELNVSVNLFNLIPTNYIGAVNPNLVVRIYNPGNMAQYEEKSLGELQQSGAWVNKKVTFAGTQVAYNSVVFEVRNIANDSQEGSDFAVDDIKIWQPTKLCEIRAEGISVNVEQNRRFAARGTASDEKCGQNDGSIFLTVDNPAGNTVEYQIGGTNSWTAVTLSATTLTQGVATITGLSAVNNGTIYVRRTGDANCLTGFAYTIKKPVPLTVTATIQAPVSCLNTFASVRFTAEGGARPYTTFRYSPMGGGTAPASKVAVNNEADFNLEQGTYRIEAVDANGCVASATFVVPNVQPLQIEVVDLEPCFAGGGTGRLQVNVLSGNGDYQFSRDGGVNFQSAATATATSFIFENLTAGFYHIVVRDGGACNTDTTYTIANPLRMQTVLVTPKSCVANSQAEFRITYSGGRAGTREFLWSNNPSSGFSVAIPTGMSLSTSGNQYDFRTSVEGDYYFKVRYRMDNGDYCEVVSDKQTVKVVAPAFTATPTVEGVNCAGSNTGKILLNSNSITGGVPPYTILFDNGLTTVQHALGDIVGLRAGAYTLTIEDSAQCQSAPMPIVITEVPAMVATVTHTNLQCAGGGTQLATILAQVTSGGTAPFTITLRKNGFTDEVRNNVQTTDTEQFNNKDIGRYQVLIEDSKGCRVTYDIEIASEANNLDVRPTATIGCAGTSGEVAVSVFANSGSTIANGQYIAVYREGIQMPIGATLPAVTTPGGDNWYRMGAVATTTLSDGTIAQAATHTFTGLAPGVRYTFVVYDTNTGCNFTKEANIKVPTSYGLEVTITGTKPTTCLSADDGKLQLHLRNWGTSGSVNYRIYKYPPTNPVLTDPVNAAGTSVPVGGTVALPGISSVGQDAEIQNIPAGRYFVLFTDPGSGCTMGSEEFTIGKSTSQLTVTATVTKQANCQQPATNGLGRIVVDADGGTAPYQYYYEVAVPTVLTGTALDNAFNNSTNGASYDAVAGTYRVYVRDANGCDFNTQITIGMENSPVIASVAVHDACSDNADYPVSVIFATKGVGQHQFKIDGIANWQNFDVPALATDNEALLPIRLAPNVASYSLSIRDANGCETSTTFRVNEMIKFQAAHTQLVPCGGGTADINVTNITGGSGTYRFGLYRISDEGNGVQRNVPIITADNVTGNTYTVNGATYNILAGDYRINVYDAATFGTSAECAQTMIFTVVPPQVPTIEVLSVTSPSCANQTSTVRVKVTPVADAPYVFNILDAALGTPVAGVTINTNSNYATFEGVPSGPISLGGAKYIITAESARSCTVQTDVAVIAPDVVSVTAGALTKKDYECERDSGYLTGETIYPQLIFNLGAVTGGTLPYSRIEFRRAGTGTVINQQTVEEGVSQYTYTLPNYLTADTNYYVQVYDANGCDATSAQVTISSTLAMSSLTASQTQALTCVNTGEIFNVTLSSTTVYNNEQIEYTVRVAGDITIAAQATLNSMSYNNVTITEPGNYVITARNLSTGCEVSTNYTVLDPRTLLLEAKDITRVTCKGGTGEVTLELTDTRLSDGDQVANGFDYVIYDIATGNAVLSSTTNGTLTPGKTQQILTAGKYRVQATSLITGCAANTTFELIEAEFPITVFAQETASVTCDNNRGEIMVTVSGGWAPYRVDIAGGAITGQKDISIDGDRVLFKDLVSTNTPGGVVTYTVTITDAWGCQIASGTVQVGLIYPDTITGTISVTQHATCFGSSDGIIEALPSTITGGSGTYYYSLIDANYETRGPQRDSARFDNLLPGIYTFEIMDTWGCYIRAEQLEVIEPKPITVSETTSNLLVCYGGNDGEFNFHVTGGRPPYTVEIVDKYTNITYHRETGVVSSTEVRAPNLAPTGAGFPAGTYKILITDSGQGAGVGCTMSPSYEFTVYSAPDLDAETAQRYNCDNNEFTTYIEVRFKDEVNFNNMTYKLNGSSVEQTFSRNNGVNVGYIDQSRFDRSIATQTLEILYTSVHSVTGAVKPCSQVLTKPVSIEEIYQLSNIVKTPTTVVNTLQVEGVGGRKPYRYEFNGEYYDERNVYELKLTDPDYTDPTNGKTYKIVRVKVFDSASENPNPGNGCVLEKVFYEEYFDVFIPNYFTPNGDGTYDTWAPRNVEKYPFIRTSIFDRYGRRMAILNYGEEWDGKYDGRDMPTGDYWYIVELSDENDSRTFHGNFTLYR